jgi:hypothetical protein
MKRKQRTYHSRVENAFDREEFHRDNVHAETIFHNDISAREANAESKIYYKEGRMESKIHIPNPVNPSGEAYHSAFHEIGHIRVHADRMKGRIPPRKDQLLLHKYGIQSSTDRVNEERLANKYARKNIDKLPPLLKAQALWSQRSAIESHMYHDKSDRLLKLTFDKGYIIHKLKRKGQP